jgi:hypothetical protein
LVVAVRWNVGWRSVGLSAFSRAVAGGELTEDLQTVNSDLQTRLDGAESKIVRRLDWLERHVRATTAESTALVLDDTLTNLADTAEHGRHLQAMLLVPQTRAAHEAVVRADVRRTGQQVVHGGDATRRTGPSRPARPCPTRVRQAPSTGK